MDKIADRKKILFLCTHNSARSQIAEGIIKSLYGDQYEAFSAGTEPSKVHPYAIKVMEEIDIDISQYRSKSINEFLDSQFDHVVTVCDQAKESCPFFPGAKNYIHKGFDDPSQSRGTPEEILDIFRETRDEIKDWIKNTFADPDGGTVS